MNRSCWVAVLLLSLAAAPLQAEPRADHCVVLVSVDGLAGFYLDDPRAELPTVRRLANEGARASGMICSFPTVTWPNHTTLVTGVTPARHGVIGNNYFDRQKVESVPLIPDPLFDKEEIVKSPTIYDVAHEAGLTTAAIVWPATRNAPTLDWTVPDMGGDGWQRFGTPSWMAELRALGVPVDRHAEWVKAPGGGVQRDWMYTRMAAHVLNRHAPNVLLVHLVEVDHVQHRVGPRSDDAYWSVSFADDRIRDIVEAIERSPKRDATTLFVCSDHGFFPIEKDIRPNVLLAQMGLVEVSNDKAAEKQAWCLPQGGACAVYLMDDTRRDDLVEQLAFQFAGVEGVDEVFKPADFARIGQPTREQNPHAADLWLSAKSGYSFTDSVAGDQSVVPRATRGGTHGYAPDQDEMLGTCVVWGAGVKPGTNFGRIRSLDVAPTMAHLLGLEIPDAEGQRLPGVGD